MNLFSVSLAGLLTLARDSWATCNSLWGDSLQLRKTLLYESYEISVLDVPCYREDDLVRPIVGGITSPSSPPTACVAEKPEAPATGWP